RPFADAAGDDAYNVELKIDHTFRVYALACRITEEESLDDRTARLVHIGALFHDTGRFVQYQRYGVYNDASTENHARLGVRELLRKGILEGLPVKDRRVVLGCVFLHNVRHLPEGLRPLIKRVTGVVRDADKLDILPIMLAHMNGSKPPNKVVTLGVAPHPTNYSSSMLEHFKRREVGSYTNMRWHNDFKLLNLTWIYDLNYQASRRILQETGHIEELLNSLPHDPALDEVRAQVRQDLAEYL
ncbi:MAG: HD domain-containing protein, partial [Proteobacteria bacterium]|nr:HD domain-containing protein [Pseudomonadota bacterium]MBU1612175.1 HD domain-containing protein [Pseudomonadota bacterium]